MNKISKGFLMERMLNASERMAEAKDYYDYTWKDMPDFAYIDGKLCYCQFRCLSSYKGGGTCGCHSHDPETWLEVIE